MADTDPEFEALLDYVRDTRGFDFTGYKRSSLVRRVERRMQQVGISSYGEYLDFLQVHADEFTALFNTILINVTGFFRDIDAWDHLRDTELPALLAARKPTEVIRVWSAGCASGEEAYTAAILLAELLGPDQFRERVKIYATDVDEEALAQARQATFEATALDAVPEQYREKYFEPQGTRFVFRSDLRRSVIFGRNDLVQDAPISRVDLLMCRNALMYLNAETQARVVARLHFAMNDDALLFLGKAEMLLSHYELFQPLDLKRRLFRKVRRQSPNGARKSGDRLDPAVDPGETNALITESLAASPVATVIVAEDGALIFSNQRADALFSLSPRDVGRPFRDLELSYRPVELRRWIEQVMGDRQPAWIRDVELARNPTETHYLDVQIAPLVGGDGTDLGVAVFFHDVSRYRKLQAELEVTNRQLETAYEDLQSTVEELETTNEELQSTVEELETTNEELQSTNEELETMNEELQSTNDELQAINDELQQRTQDAHRANAFLETILRSLDTGVIVVDRELVVLAWNRRSEDMWGLRTDEAVGQHFLNLDIGLSTDSIRPIIRSAVGGDAHEDLRLTAVNRRGRTVQVRVAATPLMPQDGTVVGVIVLVDEV